MKSYLYISTLLLILLPSTVLARIVGTENFIQTWNLVKNCKILTGEYNNPQAMRFDIPKNTTPTICFKIQGQSKGVYLQLRRQALTQNDEIHISGIGKPWQGIGQVGLINGINVDTKSQFMMKYLGLTEIFHYSENEQLAFNVSFNEASHNREFMIFYDEDTDGSFLGTLLLTTDDKTKSE